MNIDAGDAAGFRPRRRFRRPAFDRGRHGHLKARSKGNIYSFPLRPTFAKKCQQRVMTRVGRSAGIRRIEGLRRLPSDIGFVTRARLQLAYFSGYALIMQRRAGGAGVVLRFQRVRPRRGRSFPAAQIGGNHPAISRPRHRRAEALEIRHRLAGRGLPAGGDAGFTAALCLPDLRRRLQGSDDVGLSGAVAAPGAFRRLCADRVSGRGRGSLVAGA